MIHLFCDFDGTLSHRDTLDLLLERFAPPQWRDLDADMLAGRITEREGLKAEMEMITAPDELLIKTLDAEIQPAEGLDDFMSLVRSRNWPLTVLSGGLKKFAGHLWRKWGYDAYPLLANDHRRNHRGAIEVKEATSPRLRENCSHCKSHHVKRAVQRGAQVVYIGDGLTDFCPAKLAHRRYAKSHLLEHLRREGYDCIPFQNLREVAQDLAKQFP